jgi:pimeloyl-ACP methyl ester carboxylesterase
MKLFLVALVIAVTAIAGTALIMWGRPSAGSVAFAVWKMMSHEAHGGRYADINAVRIYYETYGSGPPVLILHGGTGKLEDMFNQIKVLAAMHFVVAADSRGHGRSTDADAPLSYALLADDMFKLLDHLSIRQTDIVGWSDGGIVALDLAMNHPDRVRRLVVIGANYDVDGLIDPPAAATAIPPVPRSYARTAPDPEHWPTLYRKVVTMWATQPHYTAQELAHIQAPTLVMAGEFDIIKRQHTDHLAQAISGSEEVIIPGGTHAMVREEPDLVNASVLRFLAKPSP